MRHGWFGSKKSAVVLTLLARIPQDPDLQTSIKIVSKPSWS